jgi:hypothetical protein
MAWVVLSAWCGSRQPEEPSTPSQLIALSTSRTQGTGSDLRILPAQALFLDPSGGKVPVYIIEDKASNVFHGVLPWRDGVLTYGGDAARIVAWSPPTSEGTVLWEVRFGGPHDRIRDLAVGDLLSDNTTWMVAATHDQGVVAVGREDGSDWRWEEIARAPETFVHEVEIGDLDGDGRMEIYTTPSSPNVRAGTSQPGGVDRFWWTGEGWARERLITWADTHAKEILVADVGDGPALFAVKEGVVGPGGRLEEPVQIVQLVPQDGGWHEVPVVSLAGERQSRSLVRATPEPDEPACLFATGMNTGLWRIDRRGDGWTARQVDASSRGFEQAAHWVDAAPAGPALFVAHEPPHGPREIRRYRWRDGQMSRETVFRLPGDGLVWAISDVSWAISDVTLGRQPELDHPRSVDRNPDLSLER